MSCITHIDLLHMDVLWTPLQLLCQGRLEAVDGGVQRAVGRGLHIADPLWNVNSGEIC